jgi:hypothetical protein
MNRDAQKHIETSQGKSRRSGRLLFMYFAKRNRKFFQRLLPAPNNEYCKTPVLSSATMIIVKRQL